MHAAAWRPDAGGADADVADATNAGTLHHAASVRATCNCASCFAVNRGRHHPLLPSIASATTAASAAYVTAASVASVLTASAVTAASAAYVTATSAAN